MLDFIDLSELFQVSDIHGAIWSNEGRIAVDTSLDPEANPRKLGRYRYTTLTIGSKPCAFPACD